MPHDGSSGTKPVLLIPLMAVSAILALVLLFDPGWRFVAGAVALLLNWLTVIVCLTVPVLTASAAGRTRERAFFTAAALGPLVTFVLLALIDARRLQSLDPPMIVGTWLMFSSIYVAILAAVLWLRLRAAC